MILHLIRTAADTSIHLQSCLNLLQPKDAILLFEEGVYASLAQTHNATVWSSQNQLSEKPTVYVLIEDLQFRGLHQCEYFDFVKTVTYDDFVRLTLEYEKVLTWPR